MTVSSVLSLAALLCNKEDVSRDFGNDHIDYTDPEIKKFLTAYDLVISELSEDIEPILYRENLTSESGNYYFANFAKKIKEMVKVESSGKEIDYVLDYDHIETKASSITVTYEYVPEETTDASIECPYDESVFSKRVLAKACAAEYLLTVGLFEEAVVLRKSFENAVTSYALKKKRKKMKKRTWA